MVKVLGYAFDADIHCVACTRKAYQDGSLKVRPLARFNNSHRDEHGLPYGLGDREGNAVHPIFSTDENALAEHCGDCGASL